MQTPELTTVTRHTEVYEGAPGLPKWLIVAADPLQLKFGVHLNLRILTFEIAVGPFVLRIEGEWLKEAVLARYNRRA